MKHAAAFAALILISAQASGQAGSTSDTRSAYGARLNATEQLSNTNPRRVNNRINSRINNRISMRIGRYDVANETAAIRAAQGNAGEVISAELTSRAELPAPVVEESPIPSTLTEANDEESRNLSGRPQ